MLREMDGGLVLGCDGRADSPGHSDKSPTHNEVANSGQMEKEGLMCAVSKKQDAELPIHCRQTENAVLMPKVTQYQMGTIFVMTFALRYRKFSINCYSFYSFQSMNIASISASTFNNHLSKFLVPTVMHTWQDEQKKYFKKLREMDGGLVLGCDGRADSPGHSDNGQMEKEELMRAVSKLQDAELPIHVIITDRHPQIQNHLKLMQIVPLLYCWSYDFSQVQTNRECRINVKSHTVSDGYNFCNDICAQYVQENPVVVGGTDPITGEAIVVEIDESIFGKRKYIRGNQVNGHWVICMEKPFFLVIVSNSQLLLSAFDSSIGYHFESGSCIAKVASFRESGHSPSPITFISVPLYVRGLETSLSRFGGPFSIMWLTYMNDMGTSFKELTEASLNLVTMYLRIFSSNFTIPFSTRIYNIVVKFGVNPPVLNKNA
ncbi:hypothetical protein GQR58_022514 [Nymphon striatum]|nr:hypothetical protein GQR58_022514 [Nymphon striatum]